MQLVEILAVRRCRELAAKWHFADEDSLRGYVRGPLHRRMVADVGIEAAEFLLSACAERSI